MENGQYKFDGSGTTPLSVKSVVNQLLKENRTEFFDRTFGPTQPTSTRVVSLFNFGLPIGPNGNEVHLHLTTT